MTFEIGYTLFNTLEALFWMLIGLILFLTVRKVRASLRGTAKWGSWVFVIFGFSDLLEIYIGGFLEPHQRWLFVLKIVCVVALITLLIQYLRIRATEQ